MRLEDIVQARRGKDADHPGPGHEGFLTCYDDSASEGEPAALYDAASLAWEKGRVRDVRNWSFLLL